MPKKIDKWCGNCKHYVFMGNYCPSIEICCKHRVRVIAEEDLYCYGWELDDLHDDNAMDSSFEETIEALHNAE